MQFVKCLCVFLVVATVFVTFADARKTFSSRRKSGGGNRRGGSTSSQQKPPPPQPATPHRTDTTNTNFLNSERTGSSHSSGAVDTHARGNPFGNAEHPKQPVPQSNGPIGFEKLNNQGNQKLGFDKVHSEAQQKHNVPSAPAYPGASPPYPGGGSYPGKPAANAPNGPPPAYPGYASAGTAHAGGFEPPPAYPGRPVNAPPVYSANNPSVGQRYPGQAGGYPTQQGGFQQSGFPQQHGYNPGQSNTGGNFGNYPNQGYNQGFGSHNGFGNPPSGGYGQSYPGYGGNPYGGSPSNSYGGSPFGNSYGGSSFGGNSFGGSGFGNPNYSPNNFGYSSNPGFFGSQNSGSFGGSNNYGYHKKSRFGGLPIPIPIPIPIPFGGFGGFGGHSYNHRVLDTFVKDKNVSLSDNTTTNVYILNNSTVTPCTTDQFIYDSLNITVMSCTAGNCTAVKVFTTTNVSGEVSTHSAGITMCLEPNATYSSHADNINPIVSEVHRYWMRVCKEDFGVNATANVTNQTETNVTVKVSEIPVNLTTANEGNVTSTTTPGPLEVTTQTPSLGNASAAFNLTRNNSTGSSNSSTCETFDCSWIQMCLPSIELVDRCSTQDCPFTRTGYQPCVRIKMCKSPNTPISTFATLNTTISRIDQFNNVTSINDIFNLTLISYIPPSLPGNCSQNATDPACQRAGPTINVPQETCPPGNFSAAAVDGESSIPNNSSVCIPAVLPQPGNSTLVDVTTTEVPSSTPTL